MTSRPPTVVVAVAAGIDPKDRSGVALASVEAVERVQPRSAGQEGQWVAGGKVGEITDGVGTWAEVVGFGPGNLARDSFPLTHDSQSKTCDFWTLGSWVISIRLYLPSSTHILEVKTCGSKSVVLRTARLRTTWSSMHLKI